MSLYYYNAINTWSLIISHIEYSTVCKFCFSQCHLLSSSRTANEIEKWRKKLGWGNISDSVSPGGIFTDQVHFLYGLMVEHKKNCWEIPLNKVAAFNFFFGLFKLYFHLMILPVTHFLSSVKAKFFSFSFGIKILHTVDEYSLSIVNILISNKWFISAL